MCINHQDFHTSSFAALSIETFGPQISPSYLCLINVPCRYSSKAICSSSSVFITMGPCQATGSPMGRPADLLAWLLHGSLRGHPSILPPGGWGFGPVAPGPGAPSLPPGRPVRSSTMASKDYYKTLGVARDASQDDIQRTYRKLARKYHPDVNKDPGAESKFKEISEAYEVLKDPEKRSKYDRFGSAWKQAQQTGSPPPGFEDIFTAFGFGGPGPGRG